MGDKTLHTHDDKTREMPYFNGRPGNAGRTSRNNFTGEAVCHRERNEKPVLHIFHQQVCPMTLIFHHFYLSWLEVWSLGKALLSWYTEGTTTSLNTFFLWCKEEKITPKLSYSWWIKSPVFLQAICLNLEFAKYDTWVASPPVSPCQFWQSFVWFCCSSEWKQ